MTRKTDPQDDLREIQMSIAKAVAKSANPSLEKLHHYVIEEIGYRPHLDIIDYFVSIYPVADDELEKYLKHIGVLRRRKDSHELRKHPYLVLADTIAHDEAPTVLKLRQAFIKKYGEPPSEQITQYFLKMLQTRAEEGKRNVVQKLQAGNDSLPASNTSMSPAEFVDHAVAANISTVLRFRGEFEAFYGKAPSEEIIKSFLEKLSAKAK